MKSLPQNILKLLDEVIGHAKRPVALHEPEFKGREWEYVKDCLDSGWVSSAGAYVSDFEHRLCFITGAKHAIAVVNGSAALHAALLVCGVRAGDEVLVPALTFVATANAVSYCGAIPHFIDSEAVSLGVSSIALETYLSEIAELQPNGLRNRLTGRRIAAIVPMHVFGHSCDMPALLDVTAKWSLPVVEDAAEALGSSLSGRHLGTFGKVGVLSFNGNKLVTTGGGGAVLTDCAEMARRLKHITTTAKLAHDWSFVHDEIGYNYRMPNLNAALGCAQLEKLPALLAKKRSLAKAYIDASSKYSGFSILSEPVNGVSNYWLNAVRLGMGDIIFRDAILSLTNEAGFQCRPLWTLMHRLPMYQTCPRAPLPVAEELEAQIINIPSSPSLAKDQHFNA